MATTASNNDTNELEASKSSVTIPLGGQTSAANDDDSPNDTSARAPLTGNVKNMEHYDVRLTVDLVSAKILPNRTVPYQTILCRTGPNGTVRVRYCCSTVAVRTVGVPYCYSTVAVLYGSVTVRSR